LRNTFSSGLRKIKRSRFAPQQSASLEMREVKRGGGRIPRKKKDRRGNRPPRLSLLKVVCAKIQKGERSDRWENIGLGDESHGMKERELDYEKTRRPR